MQTLASTEHVDKIGDPEWVGGMAAALVGATVGLTKGLDRLRGRRREDVDVAGLALGVARETAKLAQEMADRAVEQMRGELAEALTDLGKLRDGMAALTIENAELRSEITLLRSGQQFDRRHG